MEPFTPNTRPPEPAAPKWPWLLVVLRELAIAPFAILWRFRRYYIAALILLACISAAPILSHYAETGELPEVGGE